MTITPKELAVELAKEHDSTATPNEETDWGAIARRAAELLGVTLAPEKPELGTWHIVKDGPQQNLKALVDEEGHLLVIGDAGDILRDIHPDNTWPALAPARVLPEADYQRLVMEAALSKEQAAARRWSDGGHDAEPEDTQKFVPTREAQPVVVTEEEVGTLWEARDDTVGFVNWEWCGSGKRRWITATVNAALAKYGHGIPSREETYAAIRDADPSGYLPQVHLTAAADAVMALLGGGDRG